MLFYTNVTIIDNFAETILTQFHNKMPFTNAEPEMFTFFERTPDLVCIAGRDGFLKRINPAVIKTLGYSEAELYARPIESFIHPEDRESTRRERISLLNGKALLNFQNRYVTKQGNITWLAWTSIYFPDKEIVFAIAKDITERRQTEKQLEERYTKFKSLATHFKSSIEKDRKYLAVELHEELAQLAAVVKLDLEDIRNREPALSLASKSRMEHALAASELLITTMRRISFSISPHMLDDLGLNETLQWHCKEFSILNGIPCSFEAAYDEESLTPEIKLDFFRICQEALSNVMYHAQAGTVKISISEEAGYVRLMIIDDGKGFDEQKIKQSPGLTRMRERADSINAALVIDSATGKGTSIVVSISRA